MDSIVHSVVHYAIQEKRSKRTIRGDIQCQKTNIANVAIHSRGHRELQNSGQHNNYVTYKYTEHSSGALWCGSAGPGLVASGGLAAPNCRLVANAVGLGYLLTSLKSCIMYNGSATAVSCTQVMCHVAVVLFLVWSWNI